MRCVNTAGLLQGQCDDDCDTCAAAQEQATAAAAGRAVLAMIIAAGVRKYAKHVTPPADVIAAGYPTEMPEEHECKTAYERVRERNSSYI